MPTEIRERKENSGRKEKKIERGDKREKVKKDKWPANVLNG
jgi:hypothetical protein